jgi:hypothetical protein
MMSAVVFGIQLKICFALATETGRAKDLVGAVFRLTAKLRIAIAIIDLGSPHGDPGETLSGPMSRLIPFFCCYRSCQCCILILVACPCWRSFLGQGK